MIKVKVYASAGIGNRSEDFLEFEDDVPASEIDADVREFAIEATSFEYSWTVVEGDLDDPEGLGFDSARSDHLPEDDGRHPDRRSRE